MSQGVPPNLVELAQGVIEEACARNAQAELHRYTRAGRFIGAAKSRVLGADERCVYLEAPQSVGTKVDLQPGQEIDVYILLHRGMYRFRSRVEKVGCRIELNRQNSVLGVHVARPREIEEAQRRNDFRVTLAREPIEVALQRSADEAGRATPLPGESWSGRLVNLSRGGCRIVIDSKHEPDWRVGQLFFVGFSLPDTPGELIFLAELRHTGKVAEGNRTRLGMRFLDWPDPLITKRSEQDLGRFITRRELAAMSRQADSGRSRSSAQRLG